MKNNRLDLYKKTVDILYEAYFNDTLEHGNCYACAVGNIVAANCGYKIMKDPTIKREIIQEMYWEGFAPYTLSAQNHDIMRTATYYTLKSWEKTPEEVREQIKKTGYTLNELRVIEEAFENCSSCDEDGDITDEAWMFNGLVSVLDVLKEIHEIDDNSDEKEKFSSERKRKLELT